MNWKGPLPLCSPGSRAGIADSDKYGSKTAWHGGQFVVGIIRIQYCTGHPRVWKHIPFQTGQPVVTAGDCRPSIAKSDVLKRCPKQICLCEISQLKTLFFFFFFLHHVGEGQTKHVYGPDGRTNLQPLHLTLPVILILYSLPTPSPTNQNLTPIGRTFLLGSRSHELICRVLMGPFCLQFLVLLENTDLLTSPHPQSETIHFIVDT